MKALRPRTALTALLVVTALSAYTEPLARANGRFPRAQTVLEQGDTLVLRATFGLMISHDQGKSFRWLCEQAIGFSGAWDPPLALRDDGELFLGLENGLRTTKDGCSFRDRPELAGQLVSDLTEFHGEVWASTSTPNASAFVWRTEGGTFHKRSKPLGALYVDTLDVYRGKLGASPGRVYLTAIEPGKPIAPHFFRSDDDGVTFKELHPSWPVPPGRLFIAAIHPTNSDRVFVRSLGTSGSDLLVTEDAGATFRVAIHFDGAMFGFAMHDETVWVGSGTATEGLHRSVDGGKTFTKVRDQVVYCLRAGRSLYACSEPYAPNGYALASSTDQGATWTSLGTFAAAGGPIACDAGDGTKCVESWPQTKLMLTTDVNTTGSTADASADASAAPAPSEPAKPKSTCGCAVVGAAEGSRSLAVGLATLLVALIVLHRRGSR